MAVLLMDDGADRMGVAAGYGIFFENMLACVTWFNAQNNYTLLHEIGHLFGLQVRLGWAGLV
jgi:hypothetical protein